MRFLCKVCGHSQVKDIRVNTLKCGKCANATVYVQSARKLTISCQ